MPSSSTKPAYVSGTGTLTAQPLTTRVINRASNYATVFYLFWETLFAPMIDTAAFANPSQRPHPGGAGSGGRNLGNSGVGEGSGRGEWRGHGGGGFMSMGDLRGGGGTVDGCRATCG